ncbi:MAG: MATE family efflux transporter [Bacillus subtilis]|nr:MATE family efflux transporter [Bacillus subtilis]
MLDYKQTTQGSIFKNLFAIALPVLLTSISQMAYNLTDMFWIGRVDSIGLVESEAISGIGTAGYVTWFAFGLILIGKIGTSVRVSQAVGRNDLKAIDRYASNGLILTTLIGAVFSLAVLIFARPIISVFNIQNVAVETYALQYLRICGGLLVVPFCINGFSAINEGLGKTKTNFRVLVVGLVMNIVLDPLFILVFRMGVNGAAIATVISQATTLAIFIVLYRHRSRTGCITFASKQSIRTPLWISSASGLPSGFHSMLFTSISIFLARLIFAFGPEVMTAQRIGSQIEQFTWMIGGGFQTALTVFVGQNYGAKEFGRIRQGVKTIALMLLPYALGVGLIAIFPIGNG